MVLMYVLIFIFPFLMPKSWFKSVFDTQKRKRMKEKKEEENKRENILAKKKALVSEAYTVGITQNDIDRGATIIVTEHVRDLVEDLKREGRIRHLLRLTFLNWDPEIEPLWRDQGLVDHMHKIYQECPALPFFINDQSVEPFFEIIYTAEKGMPEEDEKDAPVDTIEEFHTRFIKEGREYFESLSPNPDHKERLDEIADACVERLEKGIRNIHAKRHERDIAEKLAMEQASSEGYVPDSPSKVEKSDSQGFLD
jgi:hypothetical protein